MANPNNKWIHNKPYLYDGDDDTYLTLMPGIGKVVQVRGEIHRNMARQYLACRNDPIAISNICRIYDFPTIWFMEYKQIHGWEPTL